MRRKVSVICIVFLIFAAMAVPVMAVAGSDNAGGGNSGGTGGGASTGGNTGGSGASGQASSGTSGNTGAQSGNVQAGPVIPPVPVQSGAQVQGQATGQGIPQGTMNQTRVQELLQNRTQIQNLTDVSPVLPIPSADLILARDRDQFFQEYNQQVQGLSSAQDQVRAQQTLAINTLSRSVNVTGTTGAEVARIAGDIDNSYAIMAKAEDQIRTRDPFTRFFLGGDQDSAGILVQYADQNLQRIQEMQQLLLNCSDCDPQIRSILQQQVLNLSQEQTRLATIAQKEQVDRGLFGWLLGGTSTQSSPGQATSAPVTQGRPVTQVTQVTPVSSSLTADEISWLTHMREEEKVARDVYLALGAKWNLNIFGNIAASEQTHMDAVKIVLDRYGIDDPAAGNAQGVFTDPGLQSLYNNLVTQGSVSYTDAIKTGILIEQTDINDLNTAISLSQHADITTMYNNLLQASKNHLSAFQANL